MIRANPDGLVESFEDLIEGHELGEPNDRHVLAAAIRSGAQVIVTGDKDFTERDLAPYAITAKTPDDFLLDLYDLRPGEVYGCVQQIADSRLRPPQTVDDVIGQLSKCGMIEFAAALRSGQP